MKSSDCTCGMCLARTQTKVAICIYSLFICLSASNYPRVTESLYIKFQVLLFLLEFVDKIKGHFLQEDLRAFFCVHLYHDSLNMYWEEICC